MMAPADCFGTTGLSRFNRDPNRRTVQTARAQKPGLLFHMTIEWPARIPSLFGYGLSLLRAGASLFRVRLSLFGG